MLQLAEARPDDVEASCRSMREEDKMRWSVRAWRGDRKMAEIELRR